jgi:hypothetical protein
MGAADTHSEPVAIEICSDAIAGGQNLRLGGGEVRKRQGHVAEVRHYPRRQNIDRGTAEHGQAHVRCDIVRSVEADEMVANDLGKTAHGEHAGQRQRVRHKEEQKPRQQQ